jgi:GT2 family glycosyltransferase
MSHRISIVLPTFNRLERLKRVLHALERQTYPLDEFEVVVVSDGSTDGTEAYLAQLVTPLQLVVCTQPNSGVAATRNHGVRRAQGDLVLFIDDDVVPEAQLVEEHARMHARLGDNVVVLGPMLTPPDFAMLPWVRYEQAMLAKQYDNMQAGRWEATARQFYTGNTSLARRLVVEAGGFDEQFRRAEDVELAYRLAERGVCFVFHPAAVGYHYAERSYASWVGIAYAYGRNDVIFTRDKAQSWLLPLVMCEFQSRHRLIRELTRLCLGRPLLSQVAIGGLRSAARLSGHLAQERLERIAFSAIFNLRYYQGVADELGGRAAFLTQANTTVSVGKKFQAI